jgi:undecaprenyl-diphosphatase
MLDKLIDAKLLTIHSPALDKIMMFATNLGDKIGIAILSLILIIVLLKKKEYLKTKIFAGSMAIGLVGFKVIKYIVHRPRPTTMTIPETGYSFPSGHATMAIIFFGMLIYLFKDEIKDKIKRNYFIAMNVFFILWIGFSRLYFNVHYPTDILGGYTLGYLCMLASIYLVKKIPFLNKKDKLFW